MKRESTLTYATYNTKTVELCVVQDEPEKYMILDAELKEFDTLIEAMKYQAEKNGEVCDLVVAKADKFDREYKNNVKQQK
jgi:hypothetical protein